jgi:UDP:flavonoid glycosyltransferase YjiC (YdhE family)
LACLLGCENVRMRVLFASTRGAGHFNPLVPFADACLRRGHEVLVAGPPSLAGAVESAGYEFWRFDDPPEDELAEVWARVPSLSPDEQNAMVIGEIYARLDATASLPGLREACAEWEPDVVVREPNEYGSAVAAELYEIPHARVAISLWRMEELALRYAAHAVDVLGASVGLPGDPTAWALRGSPYLTLFPASLDDPGEAEPPPTVRVRDPAWDAPAAELPDWRSGSDAPLVYVTFGSVAGAMAMAAGAYQAALEAVADLPVRVLLTVGHGANLDAFAGKPPNVRVEHWVPQHDVLARAAAVVCHGGSGSTLGALAAGLPIVVVPLFADQPHNAKRVAAAGAGVIVAPEPHAIRDGLSQVLANESYRAAAESLAAEMRSNPAIDTAVERLAVLPRAPGSA